MFKVIKLKTIAIIMVSIVSGCLLSFGVSVVVDNNKTPNISYTIVVDAGQSGLDVK
ncbi:MAG: hypothetical protein IJW59_02555 [Clostridia bacterium]|nr:hypothetical protein [Clostridia bacterium]